MHILFIEFKNQMHTNDCTHSSIEFYKRRCEIEKNKNGSNSKESFEHIEYVN